MPDDASIEIQLRELFQRLDQLYAHYPNEFPEKNDTQGRLALIKADRCWGQLMAQVHVLAEVVGIPTRRIFEVDEIVDCHHYDERPIFAYRQIEKWLCGEIFTLNDLSLPEAILPDWEGPFFSKGDQSWRKDPVAYSQYTVY